MKKKGVHKKTSFIEKTASVVVSFILFIGLIMMTFLVATYIGLFKKSALLHNIYTTDYSEKVQEYLYEECYDYTLPSNVPLEVIEDIFPLMKVKYDINKYAEAAMSGETYEIDTLMIEDTIKNNIKKYVKENNIVLDSEQNANLEEYIKGITTTYTKAVKVPFLNYFTQFRSKFQKVVLAGIAGLSLLILISLLILYKLQNWLHRFIRYTLYSILSTMLVIIGVPFIILINNVHEKIRIKPVYFYSLLVSTIEELLKSYIYMGMIWGIVAVCMFIIVVKTKENPISLKKVAVDSKKIDRVSNKNTVIN